MMKDKKNILIGVGLLLAVVIIVLIVVLTGKKTDTTTPNDTAAQLTTQADSKPVKKGTVPAPVRSSISFISPTKGSTLTRGKTYTVSWKGESRCYDLGYVLDPQGDTPFNFIGKVCENTGGLFAYPWIVPPNIQPGIYALELRNSGETGDSTITVTFNVK